MIKSQKKNAVLNDKLRPIRKSVKEKKKNNEDHSKVLKQSAAAAQTSGKSKQATLIALLQRPTGATIDEMATAIGWQRHSVHGMVSGVLKKKLELLISSEREERGRVYRIAAKASRL